jgi:hypothetical protein
MPYRATLPVRSKRGAVHGAFARRCFRRGLLHCRRVRCRMCDRQRNGTLGRFERVGLKASSLGSFVSIWSRTAAAVRFAGPRRESARVESPPSGSCKRRYRHQRSQWSRAANLPRSGGTEAGFDALALARTDLGLPIDEITVANPRTAEL